MGCVQANTLQPSFSAVIKQPPKRQVLAELNHQSIRECQSDKLLPVDNNISEMQFLQLGLLLGTSVAQLKQSIYSKLQTTIPSTKIKLATLSQDSYIHILFTHIMRTKTCQLVLSPVIFTHLQQLYNSFYFTPYNKGRLIILLENYARFANSLNMDDAEGPAVGKDGIFRTLQLVGKQFGSRVRVLIHDVEQCQSQLHRIVTQLPLSQTQQLKLYKLKNKLVQINKNYKQDTFKNLIFYSHLLRLADNQLRKRTKPEQIYQYIDKKYIQIQQIRNKRKIGQKKQQQRRRRNSIKNIINHLYFEIKENKNSNVVISFQDYYKIKKNEVKNQQRHNNNDKQNIKENRLKNKEFNDNKKIEEGNCPQDQIDDEKMKYFDQYLQKVLSMAIKVIPDLQEIVYNACTQNQATFYIEYIPATQANILDIKLELLHNYLNKPKPKVAKNNSKQIYQLLKIQQQNNLNKLKYVLCNLKQLPFNITNILSVRAIFCNEQALCQSIKIITKTINSTQNEQIKLINLFKRSNVKTFETVIKVQIRGFVVQIVLQLNKEQKNASDEQIEEIYYKNIEDNLYSCLFNAYRMFNTSASQMIKQLQRIYKKKQQNQILNILETIKNLLNGARDSNITHKHKQVVCLNILKQLKEDRLKSNITSKLREEIKLRSIECLKEMGLYDSAISMYSCGKTVDVVTRSKQQQVIAQIYFMQGNYQKSLEHYTEIQHLYTQNPSLQHQPLRISIANVHAHMHNYPKALEYYTKALKVRQQLDKNQSIQKAILLYNIVQLRRKISKQYIFSFKVDIQNPYQKCLNIVSNLKGQYSLDCAILYNNIGNSLEQKGKYVEALSKYSKALYIYEKHLGKYYVEYAITLSNMGNVFRKRQIYSQAIDYYQKCLKINENLHQYGLDLTTNISIKINLSICYRCIYKPCKAIQILQKCLTQIQSQKLMNNYNQTKNLRLIEASIFQSIGQTYHIGHDYKIALMELEKSLSIYSEVGDGLIDTIRVKIMMGMIKQMEGDYESSLKQYKQCQQLQQTMDSKQIQQEIKINTCIGKIYQRLKNYQQCQKYLLKSLQVYQNNQIDSLQKADLQNTIGLLYQKLEDYKTALKYFQYSYKKICQELTCSSVKAADVLANCARMYRFSKSGNQLNAVQKFKQCYSIYCNAFGQNSYQCGTILNELGRAYMQIDDNNESITCFIKALTILKQRKGPQSQQYCNVIRNISDLYFNINNLQMSLQILSKCLKIEQQTRGKWSVDYAKTLLQIANIQQKTKNYENALNLYQQLLNIYKLMNQENKYREYKSKAIQQKIELIKSKIAK